jgi:Predicted secreted acid phosphatase
VIKNKRNLFFYSIVFLLSVDSNAEKNLESLMSVLYSQTSGEIKATFVQTYNTATELLEKAINNEDWDAVLESEGKTDRTPAIS